MFNTDDYISCKELISAILAECDSSLQDVVKAIRRVGGMDGEGVDVELLEAGAEDSESADWTRVAFHAREILYAYWGAREFSGSDAAAIAILGIGLTNASRRDIAFWGESFDRYIELLVRTRTHYQTDLRFALLHYVCRGVDLSP